MKGKKTSLLITIVETISQKKISCGHPPKPNRKGGKEKTKVENTAQMKAKCTRARNKDVIIQI